MKKDLYIMHCEMLGRAFIHSCDSELQHSGTKGMKWGYNHGKRNGKRTAEDEEQSNQYKNKLRSKKDFEDLKFITFRGKQKDGMLQYLKDPKHHTSELTPDEDMALVNPVIGSGKYAVVWRDEEYKVLWNCRLVDKKTGLESLKLMTKTELDEFVNKYPDPILTKEEYISYTTNCSVCSLSYEMRRRGLDIKAGPAIDKTTYENISNYFIDPIRRSPYEDYQRLKNQYGGTLGGKLHAIYDINSRWSGLNGLDYTYGLMNEEPDGSRGIINIDWSQGGAHSMIYEKEEGEVIIRDTQHNKTVDWKDLKSRITYIEYFRTDNLEIRETALNFVEPSDKKEKKK